MSVKQNILVQSPSPIAVRLQKDLVRNVKRGHAWLYSDAVELVNVPSGSVALLEDRKGDATIAAGIYDPDHPIPFRVCTTSPPYRLDDAWLSKQLFAALKLRRTALGSDTNGFRLVAGEGDGIPGAIIDVYDRVAVMKFDGGAPEAFYRPEGIADWLVEHAGIETVVLRTRERGSVGQVLRGELGQHHTGRGQTVNTPVYFQENGMTFTADVLSGQKTGFFLDQRDNRALIRTLSNQRTVLNLFSFNGGFSVAAGRGGAKHVVSVDIARPAIEASEDIWQTNQLDPNLHYGEVADCFDFLEAAVNSKQRWDMVICDPPSFAPSEKARQRAIPAYGRLAQLAARVTKSSGLLALASCSSHIDPLTFAAINAEAFGKARRKAVLLAERGLPIDHPTPFVMPELRYLKFQLFGLE
ncbi:class I SAM-dependent rRNA methyltransferase [Aureliella helgolandensis]|uniref:Ribosomal RNA large subunit methyltransferase I n=1 Tax=Aureliella helgolandensis TaxID=2527968 RepID=A0A518GGF2_9BACT|nr:class I SAM-dependent rRNA methyltransferase [Aureliella helgolandensis]QDV27674.1 Ribosomal RNA large subunit methyltransferase I [Aureliella helgolandensis]